MVTNKENTQISPLQCRMGRAGLKLGIRELAVLADVSPNTIARFERGENLHRRTIKALQDAMEDAGAEFFTTADGDDTVTIRDKS